MRMKALLSVLIPLVIGITGALTSYKPAFASGSCEKNACRLSTGNCDLTDYDIECAEYSGPPGCWDQLCQVT